MNRPVLAVRPHGRPHWGDRWDSNPQPPGPQPGALNPLSYGHTWCWRMDSNHRLPLCKRGTLAGLSYASDFTASPARSKNLGRRAGTCTRNARFWRPAVCISLLSCGFTVAKPNHLSVARLTGFEPVICSVTGSRELQASPQPQHPWWTRTVMLRRSWFAGPEFS